MGMKLKNNKSDSWNKHLRERAEKKIGEKVPGRKNMSDGRIDKLLEEVQVHQIELEMQNEELRQAQEELIESKNRFEELYDFAPIGYLLLKRDGKIENLNLTAAGMLGSERRNLLTSKFQFFIAPAYLKNFGEYLKNVLENAAASDLEVECISKTGSRFFAYLKGIPMNPGSSNKTVCFTALVDVTKQKQAEQMIKQYSGELEKLNEQKDKFLMMISHDLRGPLQGLIGLSQFLLEEGESITGEDRQGFVQKLNTSIKRQYSLLESLLKWSMLQAGKIVIKPVKLNLHESVKHIFDLVKSNADAKQISTINKVSKTLSVFADESMIYSTLENLIMNAIKFTPLRGTVVVTAGQEKDNVIIEVEDTGVGIDEKNMQKLFHLESIQSSAGTEGEKGTGLGLIICKEMIERQGGKIWAESKPGAGSVFSFSLPLK
jgi:PAS domain S-box-containing protein